jgi:hypothetical protein
MASRVHEGWLHKGKPPNIPQTGKGNSFGRAIRAAKSRVQEICAGKENRDLIVLKIRSKKSQLMIAPGEIPARFFFFKIHTR